MGWRASKSKRAALLHAQSRYRFLIMTDISALFDRTGTIRRPDFGQLFDELSALFTSPTEAHAFTDLPDGDDQVVLVVPGFLTGDMATRPFRQIPRCAWLSVRSAGNMA